MEVKENLMLRDTSETQISPSASLLLSDPGHTNKISEDTQYNENGFFGYYCAFT